jgi:hypothetical protein
VSLYRLSEPAEHLVAPVIVAAFDGWVDAGGASTAAAALIAGSTESLCEFDGDALYDYRSRRPVLDILDGVPTELTWPRLSIRLARHGGRDILVLSGAEPDFRWRELAHDVSEVCQRLGVVEWVSLGALPAAVPHTRAVSILATASRQGLLHETEVQGPGGLLRVPAACLSTVELAVSRSNTPTVGFFAQIPHYVGGPYPAAVIAILKHAGGHLGVEFELGSLPEEALAQRQQLDALVAQDSDLEQYVDRLEKSTGQAVPSGDELASEIERFLREAERGGGSGP